MADNENFENNVADAADIAAAAAATEEFTTTNGVGDSFGSSRRSSDVSSVSYVVLELLVISPYCAPCFSSKVSSFWPPYGCSTPLTH